MNRRIIHSILATACAVLGWVTAARAASDPAFDPARQQLMMTRYEEALLSRPREGPALERLYRMHVEEMDLQPWLEDLVARCEQHPRDASLALVCGLVLAQHGDDEGAASAFAAAAAADPDGWQAPFQLGKLALARSDDTAAIQFLEAAAERTSERENRIDIDTLLGRALMRSGEPDRAIDVWDRIVQMRPWDGQAVEELAERLYEEQRYDAALRYFTLLHERPDQSAYERVVHATRLAALEAERGDADRALALLEDALGRVGPDSWLYPEIHSQVEALFLDRDDGPGLVAYYRERARRDEHSVDARLRLADALEAIDDDAGAAAELDTALSLAPTREDLRHRLATLQMRSGAHAAAVEHLARLVRDHPRNVEYRMALAQAWHGQDPSAGHGEEAKTALIEISDLDPGDPSLAVRSAEALASMGFGEEATAMYERAVALAPAVPEYHEYLGTHLAGLGRREDALRAFGRMAEGEDPGAEAVARLAETLTFHGFEPEALDAARRASQIAPDDFEIGLAYMQRLLRSGELDMALREIERLLPLAPNPYFADDLLNRRTHVLARAGRLRDAYDAAAAQLADETNPSPTDLVAAARMAMALRDRRAALEWIDAAIAHPDADVRTWRAGENVFQWIGDIHGQLALLDRIAAAEPAQAPDVWRRMAGVLMQLGDMEGAMGIAADWIASGRSPADACLLQADIQVESGDFDGAFHSLQQAIRIDPDASAIRIRLADLYRSQFMVPEAVQVYWDAMDVTEQLGGKLAIVKALADMYAAEGRFDILEQRLRSRKRSQEDAREASLLLVAAYQAIDDTDAVRKELADLAARRPKDTEVLRQLVFASRRDGDDDRAIAYQQRLIAMEPSSLNYRQLGDLYLAAGRRDDALLAWRTGMEQPPSGGRGAVERRLAWIEQLYDNRFFDEAFAALGVLLDDYPDDWSVTVKVAIAYARNGFALGAVPLFRSILDRPVPIATESGTAWGPGGGADAIWENRYPEAYLEVQRLMWARQQATSPLAALSRMWAETPSSITLDEARALATAYLATMEGQDEDLDHWWNALPDGPRADRLQALKMSIVLRTTDVTRALAEDLVRRDPEDVFARLVLTLPSQAESQLGMEAESLRRVRTHLQWLRNRHPDHAWFYDWHYLRVLVQTGADPDRVREQAEVLLSRAADDPFIAAQSLDLLQQAGLYDLYEAHLAAAAAYYRGQGAKAAARQLSEFLGLLALDVFRRGDADRSLRLFSAYLEGTRQPVRSIRTRGQGLSPAALGAGTAPAGDFLQPCYWWNAPRRNILQQMYQVFAGEGKGAMLAALLDERAKQADGPDAIDSLLAVAYTRWWSNDVDGTHQALVDALQAGANDDELILVLARFYAQLGRAGDALGMLSRLQIRYGPAHKQIQFWTLRLALEAGRDAEALAAAETLSRVRLSPEETLDVSDALAVLGRYDEAQTLERRAENMRQAAGVSILSAGRQPAQKQVEQMRAIEQMGDRQKAEAFAVRSLRQVRNFTDQQGAAVRREAIALLRRIHRIDAYVATLEEQVALAPGLSQEVENLYACYRMTGEDERAATLLETCVKPSSGYSDQKVRLAGMLVDLQDYGGAVSLLSTLLDEDPGAFFGPDAKYKLLIQAYVQGGAMGRLVDDLRGLDAEAVLGNGRTFRGGREQIVANLLNFAQECLGNKAVDSEAALAVCALLEQARLPRHVRARHAVQLAELKARTLRNLDRPEEAFAVFLPCVAGESVCRNVSGDYTFGGSPEPLRGLVWRPDAPDALVFDVIQSAEDLGRLDDLVAASRSAVTADHTEETFLLCVGLIAQGNADAAIRFLAGDEDYAMVRSSRGDRESQQSTIRALVAQACMKAGQYDHAVALFEGALDLATRSRQPTTTDHLRSYLISACRQAGRREDARDILIASTKESTMYGGSQPSGTLRQRQLNQVMEQLAELGYHGDALDVAREILRTAVSVTSNQYVRNAQRFIDETRRNDGMSVGSDSSQVSEQIARLEQQVADNPDDSAGWERLLWMYESVRATNELVDVRERMLQGRPDNPQLRLLLAGSCLKSSSDSEACDHYLAVLSLDPGRVFREVRSFRGMLWAFIRSGRVDEVRKAVQGIDWRRFVFQPGENGDRDVGRLVEFASYCVEPSVRQPELALDVARPLRRVIRIRPPYRRLADRLAEVIVQAIGQLEVEPSARLAACIELVADPGVRNHLSLPEIADGERVSWTTSAEWAQDGVRGLLPTLLDLAEDAGELNVMAEAFGAAAGEEAPGNTYLRQLFRIRAGKGAMSEKDLDAAIASAIGHPGTVDEHAYLLALLGLELSRAQRTLDATHVLRLAHQFAARSGQVDPVQSTTFFLADALYRQGATGEVVAVLRQFPAISTSFSFGGEVELTRSSVMLHMARKLWEMGFVVDAWDQAHTVLAFYSDAPSNRIRREAAALIEDILARDIDIVEGSGEMSRLEGQLTARAPRSSAPLDAIDKVYRLHRAAGRDDEALAALERMEATRPKHPATRFLLAEAYLQRHDHEAAVRQYDALLDAAPGYLFGEGNAYRDVVTTYHAVGRLPDLAGRLATIGAAGLIARDGGTASREDTILRNVIHLARTAIASPVADPAFALDILSILDKAPPGVVISPELERQIRTASIQAYTASGNVEGVYREYIRLMAPRLVRDALGVPGEDRGPPGFTEGLTWRGDRPAGDLTRLLDAAHEAGRLEELTTACADARADASDPHIDFLYALCVYRGHDVARGREALGRAREGAQSIGMSDDQRVRLLALLGVECWNANDFESAESLVREALQVATRSRLADDERALVLLSARIVYASGAEDRAASFLRGYTSPVHAAAGSDPALAGWRQPFLAAAAEQFIAWRQPVNAMACVQEGLALEDVQGNGARGLRAAREKIIEDLLPALAADNALDPMLDALHTGVQAAPGDRVAQELLYWGCRAAGDAAGVVEMERRIAQTSPPNAELLRDLARRAGIDGRHADAASLYRTVCGLDPLLLFETGDAARELAVTFVHAGRADELPGIVDRLETGADVGEVPFRHALAMGRRCQFADLEQEAVALKIMEAVALATWKRPGHAEVYEAAEHEAQAALLKMGDEEAAYRGLVRHLCAPETVAALDLPPWPPGPRWDSYWVWKERGIECGIRRLLEVAQSLNRLDELAAACSPAPPGEAGMPVYLRTLILLHAGRVDEALATLPAAREAVAALTPVPGGNEAKVLSLLGLSLVEAGEEEAGAYLLAEATSHCEADHQAPALLYVMRYAADAWMQAGDAAGALTSMRRTPRIDWGAGRTADAAADLAMEYLLNTAQWLLAHGDSEGARTKAETLLRITGGYNRSSFRGEAENLLNSAASAEPLANDAGNRTR